MRVVVIGGNFGDDLSDSTRAGLMAAALSDQLDDVTLVNGGNVKLLLETIHGLSPESPEGGADVVLWMPRSATQGPLRVKAINPRAVLIVEDSEGGDVADVCQRALKVHANLVIERNRTESLRLLDPLGNAFSEWSKDMNVVAEAIALRAAKLVSVTRIGSVSVDDVSLPVSVPPAFLDVIREKAREFDELLPKPESNGRYLGNSSFRCQRGFPSMRNDDGLLYVSKRNVDKSCVDAGGFVAVEAHGLPVQFYGLDKPSVDTPIHILLYKYYRRARYMLHGHVYVNGAPRTPASWPCGAVEEVFEVVSMLPNRGICNFALNLLGHGSLVVADDPEFIRGIRYAKRPWPEKLGPSA